MTVLRRGHLGRLALADRLGAGALGRRRVVALDDVQQVEERVGRVRVVPREGLQRVLSVQEDDGVPARAEEVLGGRGAAGPCREVVEEADAVGSTTVGKR